MKIVIEREEWQLLGQLVLEIRKLKFTSTMMLHAIVINEFCIENAAAFEVPERRTRKLKFSTLYSMHMYLMVQPLRNDTFWDIILMQFRDKVTRLFHSQPFMLTQNVEI